jgi:hypothetical protein
MVVGSDDKVVTHATGDGADKLTFPPTAVDRRSRRNSAGAQAGAG